MKGETINSHHTLEIGEHQIDIVYYFKNCWIEIYIDGTLTTQSHYYPTRQILNYANLLDVGALTLEKWKKLQQQREKLKLTDEGR